MGTRSTIALEFADGTVGQIYCHWDGYPEHNGRILFNHYQDPFKVKRLIQLGNISILGEEIGNKQSFDSPIKGQCLAYGRDRGEEDQEAIYFSSYEDFMARGDTQEYNYILRRDGIWYMWQYNRIIRPLPEAFVPEHEANI